MTRRNRLLLLVAILAVAAAAAWALRPRPIMVETAAVTRGALEQTVSEDGMTRVRDRYVVSAPLAGRIERVQLEAGDRVKQGQVLCIIEAMKLMNEIECDYEGEIVAIYVDNAQPVQYGERLFALKVK